LAGYGRSRAVAKRTTLGSIRAIFVIRKPVERSHLGVSDSVISMSVHWPGRGPRRMRAAVGASDDLGGVVAGCPAIKWVLARCWAHAGRRCGRPRDLLAGGHGVGTVASTQSERILGCCALRFATDRIGAQEPSGARVAHGAQISHSGTPPSTERPERRADPPRTSRAIGRSRLEREPCLHVVPAPQVR
jgi:hypothetical protein